MPDEHQVQLTSRELQALSTRSLIIDAAEEIFLRDGFAGSSLGAIATCAKVSKGLILHHFKSKEALWEAVRSRHQDETIATLNALLPARATCLADVERAFRAYFDFLSAHPQHMRFLLLACDIPGGVDAAAATLIPWLQRAQGDGILRQDCCPTAIFVALSGMARAWHAGRHSLDPALEQDRMRDELLSILHSGIATP